jgi:predicted aspartyl protease
MSSGPGLLLAGGLMLVSCRSAPAPPDAATMVEDTLALLRSGDVDAAQKSAAMARRLYPSDGGVTACSAAVADLLWQDDLAIAELREVVASADRAGWTQATARGRLGDQLFAAGRYGEALVPLLAGSVGDDAERRRALVAVARELPFRRKQIGPLATEQPLLEGVLPEFVCSIGERRRPFAVDTGSSMTTVARSLAVAAGVRALTDAGEVPDGTGQLLAVSMGVLDSFAVGDIWLGTVPVLVVTDERLAMRDMFGGPARAPVGVLGLDVLGLFRMTLDPARRNLVLELPRGLSDSSSVQCVRSDGRCLVPVAVEGRRLWFVLDTGASHSSLTAQGLQLLPGGEARATASFRRVRTAGGGELSVREVRNLVLRVSQTRFSGVDLPIVGRAAGTLFPVHGVLGIDLLRQCRVTLDRGRARLELAR